MYAVQTEPNKLLGKFKGNKRVLKENNNNKLMVHEMEHLINGSYRKTME